MLTIWAISTWRHAGKRLSRKRRRNGRGNSLLLLLLLLLLWRHCTLLGQMLLGLLRVLLLEACHRQRRLPLLLGLLVRRLQRLAFQRGDAVEHLVVHVC